MRCRVLAPDKYGFKERKKWPFLGEIDPDDIVVPDVRVTAVMPPELEEQFKGSIQAQGVLNPVKCIWDGQNIVLVDGLHRLMEAKMAGHKTVPAVVVPGTMRDVMLQNITTGKLQGRGKVTDMIRVLRYLVDEEKMDIGEVAAQTGYKLRYLEDLLTVARAHPDLLKALDEESIPLGAAIELARIPDAETMLRLLYQVIAYRMKVEDVRELVNKTLEVMQQRKTEEAQKLQPRPRGEVEISCFVCGEKYPAVMMKSPILCPACMGVLFEAKARVRAMAEEVIQAEAKPAPTSTRGPLNEKGEVESEKSASEKAVEVLLNDVDSQAEKGREKPRNTGGMPSKSEAASG